MVLGNVDFENAIPIDLALRLHLPSRGVVRMRAGYLFVTLILAQFSAFASPQFTKCARVLRVLSLTPHDTSVELEIRNSEPILSLLTTTDGTLAPLLPPRANKENNSIVLPPALEDTFRGVTYDQMASTPWDNLTSREKRLFLNWITVRKTTPFFEDRTVPGIKIKDKATLTFKKETDFLGRVYEAGEHEIDISHLFRKVEYGSPDQSPEFLELHFRTNRPSGEVSNGAWTFLTGISVPKNHQHVHVVSALNIKQLQSDGPVRSLMFTDYYRRANLVLEMMSLIEDKNSGLSKRESENVIFWDTLTPDKLKSVYDFFEFTRNVGHQPPFQSRAKMAYVGFRGADTYDSSDLIGFEVRGISHLSNPEDIKKYLNTLQWTLQQEHYGISKAEMEKWIETHRTHTAIDTTPLYYNQPWENLKSNGFGHRFEEIDPYMRNHFFDLEKNRELKMLIHDWSKDPLLFQKPKLLKRIRDEQIKAISDLNSGTFSIRQVMEQFLIRSGIYGIFTRSLGN